MGKVIYKLGLLSLFQKAISNNYVFYFMVFVPIALIMYRKIRNAELSEEDDEDKMKKEK